MERPVTDLILSGYEQTPPFPPLAQLACFFLRNEQPQ